MRARRLVLATRNEHKVHELRQILADLVAELDLDIVSAAEVDGPGGLFAFLPGVTVRAEAVALAEDDP